jgi:hypothetical protein
VRRALRVRVQTRSKQKKLFCKEQKRIEQTKEMKNAPLRTGTWPGSAASAAPPAPAPAPQSRAPRRERRPATRGDAATRSPCRLGSG